MGWGPVSFNSRTDRLSLLCQVTSADSGQRVGCGLFHLCSSTVTDWEKRNSLTSYSQWLRFFCFAFELALHASLTPYALYTYICNDIHMCTKYADLALFKQPDKRNVHIYISYAYVYICFLTIYLHAFSHCSTYASYIGIFLNIRRVMVNIKQVTVWLKTASKVGKEIGDGSEPGEGEAWPEMAVLVRRAQLASTVSSTVSRHAVPCLFFRLVIYRLGPTWTIYWTRDGLPCWPH